MRNTKKESRIKQILWGHIEANKKQYLSVTIIFLIGIIVGVIFINQTSEESRNAISSYFTNFLNAIKGEEVIDKGALLKTSLQQNIGLGVAFWFIGSMVIGIPLVYGLVAYRGFCLGYTISSAIAVLGSGKGTLFSLCTILFQNVLCIPAILALAVSGIKLYQSIIKDKRRENIKTEVYRHTLFSVLATVLLVVSSFIEVYVSTGLLQCFLKYI